jgi:ceramide glucosyltransferase
LARLVNLRAHQLRAIDDRLSVGHGADRREATRHRSPEAGFDSFGDFAARLAQVNVDINEPGRHNLAPRVENLVGLRREIRSDGADNAILNQDIEFAIQYVFRRQNASALNQQRGHDFLLASIAPAHDAQGGNAVVLDSMHNGLHGVPREGLQLTIDLALKIFFVLAALLALQSLVSLLDGYKFLSLVERRQETSSGNWFPSAAVIIPCKGTDADLQANLTSFLDQDYPAYQVLFVVAEESDPAGRFIADHLACRAEGGPKASLLVAGYSDERGEKVNNLLRGVESVGDEAEVLVFADIDTRPARDWLRSLVAPLADPQVTVSTGFRWYLPGPGFVSQLRAAWDTSIATLLGDHDHNFAWGGSIAIRAADFRRLGVAERYWAHTVSDDYSLTHAVREAHGRIRFEPRCLVASREESSFVEFLRWANRQIIITRVYAPRLWWLGLASHLLYGLTFLLGLGLLACPATPLQARATIALALVGIIALGMAKGHVRTIVSRKLFPTEIGTPGSHVARYWQLAPLVPWVMLYNFIFAGFTRRIAWRGTSYELVSMNELRILRRER